VWQNTLALPSNTHTCHSYGWVLPSCLTYFTGSRSQAWLISAKLLPKKHQMLSLNVICLSWPDALNHKKEVHPSYLQKAKFISKVHIRSKLMDFIISTSLKTTYSKNVQWRDGLPMLSGPKINTCTEHFIPCTVNLIKHALRLNLLGILILFNEKTEVWGG
jgi:hypothetical protein